MFESIVTKLSPRSLALLSRPMLHLRPIEPDVPPFIVAQLLGALVGLAITSWLLREAELAERGRFMLSILILNHKTGSHLLDEGTEITFDAHRLLSSLRSAGRSGGHG